MDDEHPEIPPGPYCYKILDTSEYTKTGTIKTKLCPHWDIDETKPYQMNGYCHFLKQGDWMEEDGTDLLWDQCKECGIKLDYDEED